LGAIPAAHGISFYHYRSSRQRDAWEISPHSAAGFDQRYLEIETLRDPVTGQLYDPYSIDQQLQRAPYPGNVIPTTEFSTATTVMWDTYFPANLPGTVS
jgi:hypothetical protein